MEFNLIKTKGYLLICYDNDVIRDDDWCYDTLRDCIWQKNDKYSCNGSIYKKILAHLSLEGSWLDGILFLPEPEPLKTFTKFVPETERIVIGHTGTQNVFGEIFKTNRDYLLPNDILVGTYK